MINDDDVWDFDDDDFDDGDEKGVLVVRVVVLFPGFFATNRLVRSFDFVSFVSL